MARWTRRGFFRTGGALGLLGLARGRASPTRTTVGARATCPTSYQARITSASPSSARFAGPGRRRCYALRTRASRPAPPTPSPGTFAFDVRGLQPDHEYRLQLVDAADAPLTDPWPLRTYPAPDANPASVRLLAYTCAGGYPAYPSSPAAEQPFLALALRRRLLARALSFSPDAAIAIGDHFYWDQRTQLDSRRADVRDAARAWYAGMGPLDRRRPARGTPNEAAIKTAVEPQFAELYGVMLRSTPSYFVNDDHDYFENDEATDRFVTLPPHAYQLSFGRFTRDLFMPEFLPDPARPALMSGSGAGDREAGVSESFGTFRYGKPRGSPDLRLRPVPVAEGRRRRTRAPGGRSLARRADRRPARAASVPRPLASLRVDRRQVAGVVPGRRGRGRGGHGHLADSVPTDGSGSG